MPKLTVAGESFIVPDLDAHIPVTSLTEPDIHTELDAMVISMGQLNYNLPDQVMVTAMAYMARLTEMWMVSSRLEVRVRGARLLKSQIQKVMDLMDFEFKAASRVLESMKMEMELSK